MVMVNFLFIIIVFLLLNGDVVVLYFLIFDVNGDFVIFEYIDGKFVIYYGL